jgi:hypothetical protein
MRIATMARIIVNVVKSISFINIDSLMQIYKKIVTQQSYPPRINLNPSIIFFEDTHDDEQIADQTQHWCDNNPTE